MLIYSTSPTVMPAAYRRRLIDVARWTESAGLHGILIFNDNSVADPWTIAQLIIEHTDSVIPMVAVQPEYMSPFSTARMVSSIMNIYGRSIDINLVSGGFSKHLRQLGCDLDHDQRYDRLIEFGTILRALLSSPSPVSFAGKYYSLDSASIAPSVPDGMEPVYYVSGVSAACVAAQSALSAVRLTHPRKPADYAAAGQSLQGMGIRIGIIARDSSAEAWTLAHERFPGDQAGEFLLEYARGIVESQWHHRLSDDAISDSSPSGAYWLYPFRSYKTFCPYLVGSHQEVGELVAQYLALGLSTIILDDPQTEEDLGHARRAIDLAEGPFESRATRRTRAAR